MIINFFTSPAHKKTRWLGGAMILVTMLILTKAVLLDIVYVNKMFEKNRIITPWGEKIKSGNLSVDYTIEETLGDIQRLGLNTVNVPVQIDIASLTSSDMTLNIESEQKAVRLIKLLRYKGINVILEPYPYIKNGELYETELRPDDLNTWFNNWKNKILAKLIKDIANPYKVYAFCVGSSYDKFESAHDQWIDVVDYVRKSYKGKITYRTNWWYTAQWANSNETYTAKASNPIFDKIDFISVAAYFELTGNDENSIDNLVASIHGSQICNRDQDIFSELKNISNKWNKPIFFGELGFPKRYKASVHPWNPSPTDVKNEEEQANCFTAYRTVFEKESWNMGFSIFAIGKNDEAKNYYPSDQSIEVISNWYRLNNTKTSFQRDFEQQDKFDERDSFGNTIIRLGQANRIETPITRLVFDRDCDSG
jgi:hypothetical protein